MTGGFCMQIIGTSQAEVDSTVVVDIGNCTSG